MKKHILLPWAFVLVIISIPWFYLASIWNSLPERIPVHFGLSGHPDQYGNRNEIFLGPVIMTAISILAFLILTNIYRLDPKRYAAKQTGTFLKIAMAIVIFISFICLMVLNWTVKGKTGNLNIFLVLMGLLFAYLGNIMHTIKPNYFAGFRLPWTLESEENWKATHLLASKIWFGGGILISILAIFVPALVMYFIMLGIILIMIIIPVLYSYKYFKKEKAARG